MAEINFRKRCPHCRSTSFYSIITKRGRLFHPLVKEYQCSRCAESFKAYLGVSDFRDARQNPRFHPSAKHLLCRIIPGETACTVLNISEGGMLIASPAQTTPQNEQVICSLSFTKEDSPGVSMPANILSRPNPFYSTASDSKPQQLRIEFLPKTMPQKQELREFVSRLRSL